MTDTLLLLDGHSLAYRAWFALPVENFATTTGQPTNAVYGFTAMLINVLRDEKPTRVAVAFDRSEPTFRHEKYVEYKAGRTKAPDEFRSQISLIFEVLDALGIRHLSAGGYEADDIIATLATSASRDGDDVLIVTGDRDTFQLIDDHVTVLYNSRGVSDMKRYNPAALQQKYGLTPAQYPDFAALRGDPSDNLPSIPGVGEKTATKWIVEYGSLENLVDRVGEVKGKAGDALREHLGSVLNNRDLTTLVRDMPESLIGAAPGDLAPRPWDREKIHRLFDTLQFRVLRDRLYQTFPDGLPGAPRSAAPGSAGAAEAGGGVFEVDASVLGPDEVAAWLDEHSSSQRSGVALDGTWSRGRGMVTGIAIAAPASATGHRAGAYLDPTALTPGDERALGDWLAARDRPKALHDAKGPMHALASHGFVLDGLTSDTALAAYLALPGQRTFDLADLSLRYLGKELGDSSGENVQLTLDGSGEEETALALARRAAATLDLAAALDEDLDRRGATRLLREIELPLVTVLAAMERTGIAADADHLAAMSATLHGEVKAAEQAAFAVVGHEFNLGSPKQLQEVLFTELGLPKTKRIKTGYTTDSEALTTLLASTGHPVLEHLLHHRDVAKLKSIVDSLIPMAGEDGRIHTTFNQMIAATGRLSS
ncbi:MAG: DNA polymerase, partial [Trebonia sp.]